MKRITLFMIAAVAVQVCAFAQMKPYDEKADAIAQIDQAVKRAVDEGKYVLCQVGGNWCPWCLKFAAFIKADAEISSLIEENFVYIHVNYRPSKKADAAKAAQDKALQKRLGNFHRFGYPVFVVLDSGGKVIHLQDSAYLEDGDGYDKKKVLSFFRHWTPSAVKG